MQGPLSVHDGRIKEDVAPSSTLADRKREKIAAACDDLSFKNPKLARSELFKIGVPLVVQFTKIRPKVREAPLAEYSTLR